jgi:GTPase SAR1 family protein
MPPRIPDESIANKPRGKITFRAGPGRPCAVCGTTSKGCSATADGMHICGIGRVEQEPPPGWKRVGGDCEWGYYRREGDTRTGPPPEPQSQADPTDWHAVARGYKPTTEEDKNRCLALADALGLPRGVVKYYGIGWDTERRQWTYPYHDGHGNVVAVGWRNLRGDKQIYAGGHPEIITPSLWDKLSGPVFVPEGLSGTMALTAAGLPVVGRHSALVGADALADLFAAPPVSRQIIIVGDNDEKADGRWPGRDGAKSTAEKLATRLGRPVSWSLPPAPHKDVRAYLTALHWGDTPWSERGRELAGYLTTNATVVQPKPRDNHMEATDRVVVRTLDTYQVQPVEWLYPGRIPKGKLILIAGDGGLGKSTIVRHLIAKLSRGQPAFGEAHVPDGPGDTILVATEDGFADVVIPSLLAEGADLARVGHIESVEKVVRGNRAVVQFGIEDLDALEAELQKRPNTKLIVIDPTISLVGRAGVNDFKDSELRKVLDPLSRLAERTGVTILLVAHTNKSQAQRAVDRIAGSAGMKNAVRLAYLLDRDGENADLRLLMPVKRNIPGCTETSVVFRVENLPDHETMPFRDHRAFRESVESGTFEKVVRDMSRCRFESPRVVNPDAIVVAEGAEKKTSRVRQCADFIREYVGGHAHPVKEVEEAARKATFTTDNIAKAKTLLAKEHGYCTEPYGPGAKYQQPWWMGHGSSESWIPRPDPAADTHTSPDTHNSHDTQETHNTGFPSGYPESGESGVSCESGERGTDGDASHLSVEALFDRLGGRAVAAVAAHRHDPVIADA